MIADLGRFVAQMMGELSKILADGSKEIEEIISSTLDNDGGEDDLE